MQTNPTKINLYYYYIFREYTVALNKIIDNTSHDPKKNYTTMEKGNDDLYHVCTIIGPTLPLIMSIGYDLSKIHRLKNQDISIIYLFV